ncbi:MAG: Universal stress protein [Methanonatronarchaeales archaeon]|nr:Universal stress protein [Methanonatronarchaeales archaeon]
MDILVAVDGSHVSEDALEFALDRFPDDDITVCHVAVPELEWGGFYESWETAAERGEAILEKARDLAGDHGLSVGTELLEGDASTAIVDFAEERDFDMAVVGHRGTTERRRALLGSVAEEVMEKAGSTVLVVRPGTKA